MGQYLKQLQDNMRLPDLKVRWRSGFTPNFELQDAHIRGFVGQRANHAEKTIETHDEVELLPYRKEYVMAIAEGHLWACDEKTAKAAAQFAKTPRWQQFLFVEAPAPSPAQVDPFVHAEIVDAHDAGPMPEGVLYSDNAPPPKAK